MNSYPPIEALVIIVNCDRVNSGRYRVKERTGFGRSDGRGDKEQTYSITVSVHQGQRFNLGTTGERKGELRATRTSELRDLSVGENPTTHPHLMRLNTSPKGVIFM